LDVTRVSWAIAAASARVPWRADCLLKVMAADRWLRRHGMQGEFFLGAGKNEADEFGAHAWLRYGDINVTGGDGAQFTPLMTSETSGKPNSR
jgi:hypothetical protein